MPQFRVNSGPYASPGSIVHAGEEYPVGSTVQLTDDEAWMYRRQGFELSVVTEDSQPEESNGGETPSEPPRRRSTDK